MKISSTLDWSLLVAATIFNGILAGGSLIKSVVELPARRTIGLPAMAAYHRAADLRTGLWIYPALGLAAPALTIALGIAFVVDRGAPITAASFGYLAAALSLAHLFATTRAAPNLLKLCSGIPEEAVLVGVCRGFTRWQTVRAILQVAAFVAVVLVLAETRIGLALKTTYESGRSRGNEWGCPSTGWGFRYAPSCPGRANSYKPQPRPSMSGDERWTYVTAILLHTLTFDIHRANCARKLFIFPEAF